MSIGSVMRSPEREVPIGFDGESLATTLKIYLPSASDCPSIVMKASSISPGNSLNCVSPTCL